MTNLIRPLLAGFETAHFNVGLQLGDLENADAVRRARGDSGSSISWIMGHLLDYRCAAPQGVWRSAGESLCRDVFLSEARERR